GPRAPEEFHAQFPRRPRDLDEGLVAETQEVVQEIGERKGGTLADADDADLLRAQDGNGKFRQLRFERDGGQEARATAAENGDVLNQHATTSLKPGAEMNCP